jgi:ATP-binding cassette subfamily F protein 3
MVSHDRAFIDNVCNRTIEITLGRIYDYNVNYSRFVELRKERHEQQVRAYENQQKMIADTEEFIERFRYKATKAVQVQSRIKQLEKLERLEVDLEDTSRLNLRFPPAPRSGDFPLIVEDLRKDFGEHNVFHDVTFTIRRGEKVAFVGKNGEGKTTLVKCIMGQLDYMGTLKIGHNVKIGYFAQNQAALLDEDKTVFETIDYVAVGDIRTKIRDILGAFMFGGEASEKKVKVLSGGERSRLAMIRLLLEPCNLLILDEPTNHLDMQSKDVLKTALQDFNGTLICVSHDRDFLNGLVTKVYEFGGGRVKEHLGGIYDFLRTKKMADLKELNSSQHRQSTDGQPTVKANVEPTSGAQDYAAQKAAAAEKRKKEKQIADTEAEIARLEEEQAKMEQLLALTENQTQENFQKYNTIKHQIEQNLYVWELLNEN